MNWPVVLDRLRRRWCRHLLGPRLRSPVPLSGADQLPLHCLRPGLDVLAIAPCIWGLHAWVQWAPVDHRRTALVWDLPADGCLPSPLLARLEGYEHLLVVLPQHQRLLVRWGFSVELLQVGAAPANGWLRFDDLAQRAARELGLPDPAWLTGDVERLLVLGDGGAAWRGDAALRYWQLPGFDRLLLPSHDAARLLASWLQACQQAGLRLIRFAPSSEECVRDAFAALVAGPVGPPVLFREPVHPEQLLSEIAHRDQPSAASLFAITPKPGVRQLWPPVSTGSTLSKARASVCISLYNYSQYITGALESVYEQTLQDLELIIVDDSSTDESAQVVQSWLELNAFRFARVLLLQHHANAGLAAARNTALSVAAAEWCFILDADNRLESHAVESTLSLAEKATADVAVVYGLLRVVGDLSSMGGSLQSMAWLSERSWQNQAFEEWNYVDAMALIRHSAWHQMGGFRHIPGGWEDYDFWCGLIEAGFHGLLCPRLIATYQHHSGSMVRTDTEKKIRSISRLLQQSHPWLNLPYAKPGM